MHRILWKRHFSILLLKLQVVCFFKVDGLESLNPKRLICLFFYDDFRTLHPLQFPPLAPGGWAPGKDFRWTFWMWLKNSLPKNTSGQLVNIPNHMSMKNWLHLLVKNTEMSWAFPARKPEKPWLHVGRIQVTWMWWTPAQAFLQQDPNSHWTVSHRCAVCEGGLPVAVEKGNGGKDEVTMWPTLNVDVKQ